MLKYKIIVPIDSYKHFSSSVQHYEKLLWKNLEIIKLKPSKGDVVKIITQETEKIIKILKKDKNSYKILLSLNWKCNTTDQLVKLFSSKISLTFIIWGPYGLDEGKIDSYIDMKLSFGYHTKSHLLVLVELLEQIFRVENILQWGKYHK